MLDLTTLHSIAATEGSAIADAEAFTLLAAPPPGDWTEARLEEFLDQHEIAYQKKAGEWPHQLAACPFCGKSSSNPALRIRDGHGNFKCFHASCNGEQKKTFADFVEHFEGVEPVEIRISPNDKRMTDAADRSLIQWKNIYQRGGMLVHITTTARPPKYVRRPADSPIIAPVSPPAMTEILSETARFLGKDRKGRDVRRNTPQSVVRQLLARTKWSVPVIERISEVPVLLHDGTILNSNGFHAASGIYLDTPLQFKPMGVQEALACLLDIYREFPFESEADKAVCLAGLISPMARSAYDGCTPLFAIGANAAGCGKGLCADTFSVINTSRSMARASLSSDEEEVRKRITSLVLEGSPLVLFDNVKTDIGGPTIEALLTAETWSDRILGRSESVSIPLSTVWYVTGNNLTFQGDAVRRTLHCYLKTAEEHPEQRKFERANPLLKDVLANRSQLVSAGLSILKGYIDAGRPDQGVKPFGSFESWSGMVRNALIWAGMADPLDTQVTIAEVDDDRQLLLLLLAGWEEAQGKTGLTVAEALRSAEEIEKNKPRYPRLREAIDELSGDKKKALAYVLSKSKNTVAGGKRFVVEKDKHTKVNVWKVVDAMSTVKRSR